MEDIADMVSMLAQQAQVHERNGHCVGLPYCASCRAATLLNQNMGIDAAQAWIDTQKPGTVVLWKPS